MALPERVLELWEGVFSVEGAGDGQIVADVLRIYRFVVWLARRVAARMFGVDGRRAPFEFRAMNDFLEPSCLGGTELSFRGNGVAGRRLATIRSGTVLSLITGRGGTNVGTVASNRFHETA